MLQINNYDITDEELGKGGMGVVYKACRKFPSLGRRTQVACKAIRAELSGDANYEKMFIREAFTAMKLAHPNLVQVHDCYKEEGRLYLFMEYIDGMSLDALIARHGPLPDPVVAHIVHSVARALSYLHAEDICHRDVSPPNVLISKDGRAKLSDFGLARTSGDDPSPHGFKGRIAFACPQRLHTGQHSFHSDLWALLITAYYAASGYLPFGPNDSVTPGQDQFDEILTRITTHDIAKPEAPFSPFLEKMLEDLQVESPSSRRFQRAGDLSEFVEDSFAATPKLPELGRLVQTSDRSEPARQQQRPARHCALANTQLDMHAEGVRRRPSRDRRLIVLAILCFVVVAFFVGNGFDPIETTVKPRQDPSKEPGVHGKKPKEQKPRARKARRQKRQTPTKEQKSTVVVRRGRTIPMPSKEDNP